MAGFACFVAVKARAAALLTALLFDLFFFVITFRVSNFLLALLVNYFTGKLMTVFLIYCQ